MMKTLFTLISIMLSTLCAQAQVWMENTSWQVNYEDHSVKTFALKGKTVIEGTEYLNLIVQENDSLIGYVRSERNDTVVYARGVVGGNTTAECVLYDFSHFTPDGYLGYSKYNYVHNNITYLDDEEMLWRGDVRYYHDVLQQGDSLMVFQDVVDRVGYIGNPMELFYNSTLYIGMYDTGIGNRPMPKAVDHVVLTYDNATKETVIYPVKMANIKTINQLQQQFAFNLFNELDKTNDKGVLISPLSIEYALAMLLNGAQDNTKDEIVKALGMEGYSNDDINNYYLSLTGKVTYRPEQDNAAFDDEAYERDYPQCEVANSFWASPDMLINNGFQGRIKAYYKADTRQEELNTIEGMDMVNRWVDEKTHNLIPQLLNKPYDGPMLLINALYYKGIWSEMFEKELTKDDYFTNADGSESLVKMMNTETHAAYSSTDRFSTVTLKFGRHGNYSMTFFLPNQENITLNTSDWQTAYEAMAEYGKPRVKLSLPRFEMEGSYTMNDMLMALGINDAFLPDVANFKDICMESVFVDEILHKSKITVDEKGTEAAAVTEVSFSTGLPNPEEVIPFQINRPFFFTIEQNSTGTLLFVGHVRHLQDAQGTGITEMEQQPNSSELLYDLMGRKLNHIPAQGLYIKNGKIMMR